MRSAAVALPPSTMVSPDALVRLAGIAKKAGEAILAHYADDTAPPDYKADHTPVTAADRAAHRVIVEALAEWDPAIPVVSEEGDIPGPEIRSSWGQFWLVDPLDGTKEFVLRNGEFTVNIACIEDGEPVLGVVYAPALDLLYYAGRGLGAWKCDRSAAPTRIVSRPPSPGQPLRVVESRSHPSKELEDWIASIAVAERVAAGSSLKFCLVAEGKADVYPRFGPTMEWDVAAGDCVFRNSGFPAQRRSPLRYNQPDLKNDGFVIGLQDQEADGRSDRGRVIWLTGLSGSGKSTIARRLVEILESEGRETEYLDGDTIRDIFPATGFSREEREAHVRRVGFLASRLERHGVTVVVSLISPYEASRQFVRGLCRRFTEVFVATPLEECERRDVKGLYARARRGEIKQFTGIDDPYEAPRTPELVLDTAGISVEEAANRVLAVVR